MAARKIIYVFVFAVILNYIWEMAQMPFFAGMAFSDPGTWKMCFIASIKDAVIVLAILAIGRLLFRHFSWPDNLNAAKIVYLGISGALVAIYFEIFALRSGEWAYSNLMPVLPYLNVGIVPLLQLMLLPYLSYLIGVKLAETKKVTDD